MAVGIGLALWATAAPRARVASAQSGLVVNGTTLTVTTSNAVATFNRADLVGFQNTLTGENYLRLPTSGQLADVDKINGTGQSLQASNWSITAEPGTGHPIAGITLSDVGRTLVVSVKIDPGAQEIVIRSSATVTSPGVRSARWGIAGLDLLQGRLIVPAHTGTVFDSNDPGVGEYIQYPNNWHAQMAVYETAQGSLVLYSTDLLMHFKRLQLETRGASTIDASLLTEAVAPFTPATAVPQVEWRLKAVSGDWRAAAQIFKTWLLANRPPTSKAAYPWVADIRAVVTMDVPDTGRLAALGAMYVPAQTLIYVFDWRNGQPGTNDFPIYTPRPETVSFISTARGLGFRVMLHTDLIGVSPLTADYAGLQQFHVRTPDTLQLVGWRWNEPPGHPQRYGYISPAAAAFRSLWIARVGAAIAAAQPDAIHLDLSGPMHNDGNGLIEGRTFAAGSQLFHDEIVAAFPGIALGGEAENDMTYRYHAFAQSWGVWIEGDSPGRGHPIGAFIFSPQVQFYGHLGMPSATFARFKARFIETHLRGSPPTMRVTYPEDVDLTKPDAARLAAVLQSWQTHAFQLDPGNWGSALVRYLGIGGATAELTDSNNVYALDAAGVPLYRMAHDANQVVTTRFLRGWPAFDADVLYGLDPTKLYWLDPIARPTTTHLTSLPGGVRIGTSTKITPAFAHVELLPIVGDGFSAEADLLNANSGVRFQGADTPLGNGAVVSLSAITAGGVTRSGLFLHPPFLGQVGGETFVEHAVAIPSAALLQFGVGVADNANCTDGVTFRVAVNGSDVWAQHVTRTGWQDVTVGLGAYAGTTALVRFTSHPGPANNAGCDWSLWSGIRIAPGPAVPSIAVPVSLEAGSVVSGFAGDGMLTQPGLLSAAVANVPVPGRFTIFTQTPTSLVNGSSLTSLPFVTWLQPHGELATVGSVFSSGTIGPATAGGVTKTAIESHPPFEGATSHSWTGVLPAGFPMRLGWSAGLRDGSTTPDGVAFEVRINGLPFWRNVITTPQWLPGNLDLAAWQGQPVLIELVTDSISNNNADRALWADLILLSGGASCSYSVPSGIGVGPAGTTSSFTLVTGPTCPWEAVSNASWLSVTSASAGSGSATVTYSVTPNWGAPRTATITVGGQTFTVTQAAGSANAVQNGAFDSGLAGWTTFATPDPSYIVASIVGGVLEFYRQPSPGNQATVFQNTGLAAPAGLGIEARFDLGNSSTARKRVSVLVLDSDFSDLFVCTFWLAPGAPLQTYRMRTHTTKPWANASIYFYAATAGSAGGAYRLDNVSVHPDPAVSADETACIDPTAPAPVAVADGPAMLVNGDFASGLPPWGLFGQIVGQVTGGVFEFYRPGGTPAGVILQNTAQALPAHAVLTATFELGNSSAVKKRVTVILHDNDFSDLAACTFWLPAGQPLSPYVMRTFTTQAWTAATLSVYPATVGADAWIQLDNATLRRTPSTAIVGTECGEPTPSAPPSAALSLPVLPARGTPPARPAPAPAAPRSSSSRRGR